MMARTNREGACVQLHERLWVSWHVGVHRVEHTQSVRLFGQVGQQVR